MQTVGEQCSKLDGFFSGDIMNQFLSLLFPPMGSEKMNMSAVHRKENLPQFMPRNLCRWAEPSMCNISLCPRHTVSISVVCWAGDKKPSEFQVCLLCRPIRQVCTAVTFRSFRVGIQNRVAQGTTAKVSSDTVQTDLHIKCNGSQLQEPDINEWHSALSHWSGGW